MASIRKVVSIDAPPEEVWDAVRDVGALHTRLVPGFVVDTKLEEGARLVTFGDGVVARELIVDIDDGGRRLAYAIAPTAQIAHYNAVLQVLADGDTSSRIVWTIDLLPDELEVYIAGRMEQGIAAMKPALGRA